MQLVQCLNLGRACRQNLFVATGVNPSPSACNETLPTRLLLHRGQPGVCRPWQTRSPKSICEQIDLKGTASPCFDAPENEF
jgi:hypothetical protein